jgi:hypothetical protein
MTKYDMNLSPNPSQYLQQMHQLNMSSLYGGKAQQNMATNYGGFSEQLKI